jgi:glycosyltransferase involved in cell wall biosynthesis
MPDTLDMPSLQARPQAAATPWPSVVLFIPTFRRPDGLRKLLTEVGKLSYPGALSVIVIENDEERLAGAAAVTELAQTFPLPLRLIVEPERGQTHAYNRGFLAAAHAEPRPDYIAVLDDDEYPDHAWLTRMVATARAHDADIVGGPVLPVFDDPRHWLARTPFFQPRRYATGPVDMIYGVGSMLARRSVIEDYLDAPFSHAFAFTGGSDLEFFTRCRNDGRSFAWADDAIVLETTPRARTTISWLLRRNFRKGSERVRIEQIWRTQVRDRVLRRCRAIAQVAVGSLSLPFAALRGRAALVGGLSRIARGAGGIAAEFNIFYDEYR